MLYKKTKNPLTSLFTALSLLTVCVSMSHAQVTLTVGKGSALPGTNGSPVSVSLDNPSDKVSAAQMDVCDTDDYLTCTGCQTTDRTSGFTCLVNELANGCCRVVLTNLSSDDLENGNGPIFTLLHSISSDATGCRTLSTEAVSVSDDKLAPLTVTTQPGGFCFPCSFDSDCNDGLYCTGGERCIDDACEPGSNPCSIESECDEANDDCDAGSTSTTSGPSSTTTTEPSTTTTAPTTTTTGPSSTTTTTSAAPSMEIVKDTFWKSRWVALPYLLVIKGNETSFQAFETTVAYDPSDAVLKLFPIVLGNNYIWNIILVMPSWFAGTGDQEVAVTVTTGDEIVSDSFTIRELPFILERK